MEKSALEQFSFDNSPSGNFHDREEAKERLLSLLPQQLQKKWQEAPVDKILGVIKQRERLGYKKITGFHASNRDLSVGSFLLPDDCGEVCYADNLQNLYGKHGGGFLYIVEGTADDKIIDESLGWRKTKGKLKIIDKIKITPKNMKCLGADFADCEYH